MTFFLQSFINFFLFFFFLTPTKCSAEHLVPSLGVPALPWGLRARFWKAAKHPLPGTRRVPAPHGRTAVWRPTYWYLQQLPEEFGKRLMEDRTEDQRGDWTPWNQGTGPGTPPAPTKAAGPALPVVPERRAWPASCPYTEAAWGKALKGGTEAPAGTPEPTCCRSKKAELDKEEGVELELDTSGLSCFMAKGE